MFDLQVNTKGTLCVITDNASIAELIQAETQGKTPVWYTGAPTMETAKALAAGLESEFGAKATYSKRIGDGDKKGDKPLWRAYLA